MKLLAGKCSRGHDDIGFAFDKFLSEFDEPIWLLRREAIVEHEIADAEYKVVEHQIAPPLHPTPRWRFQRLARGTGSGRDDASYAELVKPRNRRTAHNLSLGGTEAIRAHPRPNAGRTEVNRAAYPRLPVSKYFASVYKICQAMVDSSSKPGDA